MSRREAGNSAASVGGAVAAQAVRTDAAIDTTSTASCWVGVSAEVALEGAVGAQAVRTDAAVDAASTAASWVSVLAEAALQWSIWSSSCLH